MKKELNEFSPFVHTRLNAQSWMIQESYGYNTEIPNSYLNIGVVVGEEKVAVLDAGIAGTSGLRDYIEQVILGGENTKPILCLLGHNHVDHIGACMMFDERYMHEADINEDDILWGTHVDRRILSDDSDLCAFANYDPEMIAYCRAHYYKPKPTVDDFIPVHDGDVIDLGGVTLQVSHLPGHSKGSVGYYDAKNHVAYTSDSLSPSGDVNSEYAKYTRIAERWAPDTLILGGHGPGLMGMRKVYDMIACCEEVFNGENLENDRDAVPFKGYFKFTKATIGLKDTRFQLDPNRIHKVHKYRDVSVTYSIPKND